MERTGRSATRAVDPEALADGATLASVVALLADSALLASLIPALKAARKDSLETLKVE